MKRISIAVIALVACLSLALVSAASADAKVKKFRSTLTLGVAVTEPTDKYSPGAGRFSGQVSSRGPKKCHSGRLVTVFRNEVAVTQVVTGGDGSYTVTIAAKPPAGTYTASVRRRFLRKKNKKTGEVLKIKCKGALSNAVPVT